MTKVTDQRISRLEDDTPDKDDVILITYGDVIYTREDYDRICDEYDGHSSSEGRLIRYGEV